MRKKMPQYAIVCRADESAVVATDIALDSIQQAQGIAMRPTKKTTIRRILGSSMLFSLQTQLRMILACNV